MPSLTRSASCLIAAATAASALAATGPIAHWKFNESVGPTVSDDARNFPGTLQGGASFAPGMGIEGGALLLSRATSDRVLIGDVLPLTGQSRFSIVVWVRLPTPASPDQFILGRHRATVVAGYFIDVGVSGGSYGAPGKAWFYASHGPGPEPISTTSLNDDQWHQVVFTRDPSMIRVYVDGAPAEQSKTPVSIGPTFAPLMIGGLENPSGSPFGACDGLLDDIQIYNRVLSDADIDFLFANPGSSVMAGCGADITHGAVPGTPGYGLPNCELTNDDFFYYLAQFAAGNLAVADLTTGAVPGQPGYGVPNGVLSNDDFFYYLAIFAAGC
ncbi:MAG: LamG domain-containing protein [Phycisphaeraceae bacterium]|nr:LamG domain-containing protein [Phycisphaeraceae bacterium]